MKKKNNSYQKGFTLLETLVAIFILTLSITGPVYIASVAFHNTLDSRDNISAQYIAEEVVEVIRNKRDKFALIKDEPSNTWVTDIGLTVSGGAGVECLNITSGTIDNKCSMTKDDNTGDYVFTTCNDTCLNISFDPTKKVVYGQSEVDIFSKFTREFYLEKEGDNGVKVVVNIKWSDKGRDKVYTLTERLYNVNYKKFFIEK
jgi:prepilin-type N-terminal cleavage/methylation domain-containing protein